jgi:predicted transcriptional regulator
MRIQEYTFLNNNLVDPSMLQYNVYYKTKKYDSTSKKGKVNFRRTKLETCMAILETLARYGPLKITHVMQKANINSTVLKNYFAFLIKQGAIEGKYIGRDKIVFMITERGLYLTKCFIELNQVIPTGKIRNKILY